MSNLTQTTEKTILRFDSPQATLAVVGGKGANLAILSRSGFPVPGGFLVTTAAYRSFVAENQLDGVIAATLAETQPDNPMSLQEASSTIRARFVAGKMPDQLGRDLLAAYQQISSPPVAVRSSATAEDLPDMSFAGQQDTYLNILGEDELTKAVINCWGSLWTARAIGYRARNGIDHLQVSLSVVVQQMVQSEASGVLFTANPLTGKRHETVIDATLGLGEALVSGQVEPDHYIVDVGDKANRPHILSKTLGAKALAIRSVAGGGTVTMSENATQKQAIPDNVIADLAALGQRVAAHYGTPQDIEWGWADNKLYLLQARPVTSLFPLPTDTPSDPLLDPFWVMVSFGAVQGMLDPMTPLGRDTIESILGGMGRIAGVEFEIGAVPMIKTAGERLWVRIDHLLGNRIGRRIIQNALKMVEPSAGQAVETLLSEPRWANQPGLPTATTFLRFGRALAPLFPRLAMALIAPVTRRRAAQRRIEAYLDEVQHRLDGAATLAEQVAIYESATSLAFATVIPHLGPCLAAGMFTFNRLLALSRQYLDSNRSLLEISRGLPNNVTTEMDLALWAVARQIKADRLAYEQMSTRDAKTLAQNYLAGTLMATAQQTIANFMQRYGMRGLAEIDFGRRRWRDDPTQVMQMIQSYLQIHDPELAPDAIFKRGEVVAEAAIAKLIAAAAQTSAGALKAQAIRWLASRMRHLLGLRETPKFLMIRMMGILRQSLLVSGEQLVAQGVLTQTDDLFFLHVKELNALAAGYAIDWKALIRERRNRYEREKLRRQIPRVLVSDGRAFYDGMRTNRSEKAGQLLGSPVSPGTVEGIVHVVFDPHQAQLAPGEILVCPGTDPAWTPLFLAAGGLVMEVGGLMTHGSVVAREYGIPAVVGVHNATSRLRSGQRIRVDGSQGEVTVLEESG